MSAPDIVETPVVASDCVRAVAISEKLELSSDDLINPPGTNAAIGKEYVPFELLGTVIAPRELHSPDQPDSAVIASHPQQPQPQVIQQCRISLGCLLSCR
jgi:hypothetical protein